VVQVHPGPPFKSASDPETWVTECTGYIGNNLGPNGFSSGSSTRVSRSKYPQIIIHKASQPDVIVNFLDADSLAGKDRAEANFLVPQADASALVTTIILS
jgi:hypothetical protein